MAAKLQKFPQTAMFPERKMWDRMLMVVPPPLKPPSPFHDVGLFLHKDIAFTSIWFSLAKYDT